MMRSRPSWSVHTYLVALVLGVALPLTALLAVALYTSARQDEAQALEAAAQIARISAAEAASLVTETRKLLAVLAERPRIRDMDPRDCGEVLDDFESSFPVKTTLVLTDSQGHDLCPGAHGTEPADGDKGLAGEIRATRFQISRPYQAGNKRTWVVSFVQPVFDNDGELRGRLLALLDLQRYRPGANLGGVARGAVVTVVTEDGTVIARSLDSSLVGSSMRGIELYDLALRDKSGAARAAGRIHETLGAFVPVEGVPWIVIAAFSAEEVLASARTAAQRSASAVVVVLLVVALWAWWLAKRISGPVQAIAQTARAVAEGSPNSRASANGPVEIRQVARQFNQMLDRRDAAERNLRESNLTLELVQEASAAGIWDWNLATDRVTYNRRFQSLAGYDDGDDSFAREFVFRNFVHPEDRDRVGDAIERHLADNTPFHEEFRLRGRTGTYRWFSGRGLALRDQGGKALRFAGSIVDITARKRAELDVRESKERFELAVRGTTDGIWDWDIVHDRHFISPQYKALLGYAEEDLPEPRQSFLQHLHPDDLERITRAVNEHLQHQVPFDAEYRLRCRGGDYKWFRGRGQAVWDPLGRPLRMAGSVSDITARKQAEAALRESEAKYRLLLETSTDAVLMVDEEERILFASRALTDILGYDVADVVGRQLELLRPARLREERAMAVPRRVQGIRGARHVETLGLHRDGREIPVEVSFSELQLEGRRIFAGFLRDISERKQAEIELRQSERLFREIADSSPAFIWMADTEGDYFYVNRPWLEFTGRTPEQEAGSGWLEGIHEDDREHFRRDYLDAFSARRAFRLEYRLRRHDGQYRWLLDQGVPRFDEQGSFIGYLGSCVDITQRVEANERIHRLSDMYAALSQVNDAIARAKSQQRLFERVCQITARFGSFVTTWIGVVDQDRRNLRTAARSGELETLVPAVALESSMVPASPAASAVLHNRHEIHNDLGTNAADWGLFQSPERVRSAAVFPLRRSGQVIGVFVAGATRERFFDREIVNLLLDLVNNLSFALDNLAAEVRRQKTEEEIREINATLEQRVAERTLSLEAANRELEAFSYSVSHDLRAPLRGISGFSEILMEKYAPRLDDEGLNCLQRVKTASERMSQLIDGMLALARISRAELRERRCDLTALAEEVVADLRHHDPERRVEVAIARGLVANADPVLLRSVLENLLGNAWKFSSGRDDARIEVGAGERAGQPAFFVRDNGAGFNMAYADKLFAPFQRLHTEQEFRGTGIGLATVQRIVHRHKGRIWCEAAEGQGASFYFTLGLARSVE
jgi:PAS domain S-box-containing protein